MRTGSKATTIAPSSGMPPATLSQGVPLFATAATAFI
jgi:hypothetical protein